jgi:enterobacteria phage integrase
MSKRRRLPLYVNLYRDRHGKIRVYFRRKGQLQIPLPTDVRSEEFRIAYRNALAGQLAPTNTQRQPVSPRSIGALILSYQATTEYKNLKPNTNKSYTLYLDKIREAHGHRSVSGLNRAHLIKILEPYAGQSGVGTIMLILWRILIKHALILEWLDRDPSVGMKRPKGTAIKAWTDDEISAFEKRWLIGTVERTTFALLLYTGQRGPSDVRRMTWADIKDNSIKVVQTKTNTKLTIALHRDLKKVLAGANREHLAIITHGRGKTYTEMGFSCWFREAMNEAGISKTCRPHGLRVSASVRLAEAGCSAHEIMSITGHKSLALVQHYTQEAEQKRLSKAAIKKLERS